MHFIMLDAMLLAARQKGGGLLTALIGWSVIGLGVFVFVLVKRWREKQRTQALAVAAEELGLPFQAVGDESLLQRLSSLSFMNTGRKQQVTNLMVADTSHAKISLFDFRYTVGSGKHTKVFSQSVLAMEAETLECPAFSLRPEGGWDRMVSMVGGQDIDFEEHAAFSSAFVLKGDVEDEVRAYLDRELLEFFTTRAGIYCEASSGVLVYFRRSKRVAPVALQLQGFLEEGMEVFVEFLARRERDDNR
jgi:hypothetical protein